MIPTLSGRIQTRIFLLVVVGGIWTLIVTPFVKLFVDDGMGGGGGPSLGQVYKVTFTSGVMMAVQIPPTTTIRKIRVSMRPRSVGITAPPPVAGA